MKGEPHANERKDHEHNPRYYDTTLIQLDMFITVVVTELFLKMSPAQNYIFIEYASVSDCLYFLLFALLSLFYKEIVFESNINIKKNKPSLNQFKKS